MCTAVAFKPKDFFFGRTLDSEVFYKSEVTFTPRNFPFDFRFAGREENHYAILGMACVYNGFPLYFDGMNEQGLCAAGLSFAGNAVYRKPQENKINVASFELIPYILAMCGSVDEAKILLRNVNITDTEFSCDMPPSPLHWMISDEAESITVEAMSNGLRVYHNPVGVLTNNPPFCVQMKYAESFLHLTPMHTEIQGNTKEYSEFTRGSGAKGLPGDYTSQSRFVRAIFVKNNSACELSQESGVNQFFHILDSVAVPRGCCLTENGEYDLTRYACCMSVAEKAYYYKTYESNVLRRADMKRESLNSEKVRSYPLVQKEKIIVVN